jgi:hypothetical protein
MLDSRLVRRSILTEVTRTTRRVRRRIRFAVLVVAVSVPSAFGTTLIGIRTTDGFVIAADSKVTYRGPGIAGPATVCKIYQTGPLYFALAGLASDRSRDFYPGTIVASNYSATDSFARNVEKIERAISESLIVEMKRMKTEDPDGFAFNQRPGADTLDIIGGEMVNGTPQMFGRGFIYVDETATVSITRRDCPGDCANGVMFFFAGRTDVVKKKVDGFFSENERGIVHDPVTDARNLVEDEVQASPEDVGPPITVLRADKDGASWVSNDSGCPAALAPEN